MKEYISKRTQSDIDFFYLTDKDIIIAFQDVIKEDEMNRIDIKKILMSPKILSIIMIYKCIYNRARPSQVAPDIINKQKGTLLDSKTANTPSYPSGHAFQAYYLAKILSQKFPKKNKGSVAGIAKPCEARVIAPRVPLNVV